MWIQEHHSNFTCYLCPEMTQKLLLVAETNRSNNICVSRKHGYKVWTTRELGSRSPIWLPAGCQVTTRKNKEGMGQLGRIEWGNGWRKRGSNELRLRINQGKHGYKVWTTRELGSNSPLWLSTGFQDATNVLCMEK